MSSAKDFRKTSYQLHADIFKDYGVGGDKAEHAKTWFKDDTVDAWRHDRMYQALDPILKNDPLAKWLTVGDGRYGRDAKYILEKGCSALATDISDVLLKEAKEIGYIADFRKENAESLSFQDSEYGYVFCKESYHHFPRPMIALYEMLRVANKGVMLVEPNDPYINHKISEILFRHLKNVIKYLLGRDINRHRFEETGNYLFAISRREIEKAAMGLDYRTVAFKGINDAYFEGMEYEQVADNGPLKRKANILIKAANAFCKLGFMDYGIVAALIFKEDPPEELLRALSDDGYDVVRLPANPYVAGQP